jgi:hypothetical protein
MLMPDDLEPRVDLLERLAAQQAILNDQLIASTQRLARGEFLHDAAQHRHSEALDRHTETLTTLRELQERQQQMLDGHAQTMTTLRDLQERQQQMMDLLLGIQLGQADRIIMLEQQAADLRQLMQAIKDMLERPNGH